MIENKKEKIKEEEKNKGIKKWNDTISIIKGEIKTTISNRYWALVNYFKWQSKEKIEAEINNLKNMPYKKFLNTLYWEIIRNYVFKKSNFSCELCLKKGDTLNIHHKTYSSHGEELFHLEDLIVLCRSCHEKTHNISKEKSL